MRTFIASWRPALTRRESIKRRGCEPRHGDRRSRSITCERRGACAIRCRSKLPRDLGQRSENLGYVAFDRFNPPVYVPHPDLGILEFCSPDLHSCGGAGALRFTLDEVLLCDHAGFSLVEPRVDRHICRRCCVLGFRKLQLGLLLDDLDFQSFDLVGIIFTHPFKPGDQDADLVKGFIIGLLANCGRGIKGFVAFKVFPGDLDLSLDLLERGALWDGRSRRGRDALAASEGGSPPRPRAPEAQGTSVEVQVVQAPELLEAAGPRRLARAEPVGGRGGLPRFTQGGGVVIQHRHGSTRLVHCGAMAGPDSAEGIGTLLLGGASWNGLEVPFGRRNRDTAPGWRFNGWRSILLERTSF